MAVAIWNIYSKQLQSYHSWITVPVQQCAAKEWDKHWTGNRIFSPYFRWPPLSYVCVCVWFKDLINKFDIISPTLVGNPYISTIIIPISPSLDQYKTIPLPPRPSLPRLISSCQGQWQLALWFLEDLQRQEMLRMENIGGCLRVVPENAVHPPVTAIKMAKMV